MIFCIDKFVLHFPKELFFPRYYFVLLSICEQNLNGNYFIFQIEDVTLTNLHVAEVQLDGFTKLLNLSKKYAKHGSK